MVGFFIQPFLLFGVGLFAVGVVFSLITLPVEWDASKRAKVAMAEAGMLSQEENHFLAQTPSSQGACRTRQIFDVSRGGSDESPYTGLLPIPIGTVRWQ